MDDDVTVHRGHLRSREYRRVTHGVFLDALRDADPQREWLRDLAAWQAVLPAGAVFTGLTAARLAGWVMPSGLKWVPVFASVAHDATCPQRSGLVVTRLRRDSDHRPGHAKGFPVDHPAEVLLRCARDLQLLDLVPMVESALAGSLTRAEITAVCSRPRPGVRLLRRALSLADERSESAMETVTRLFAQCLGLDVEVQPEIRDAGGLLVARGDLRIRGTTWLIEFDGAGHRSRSGQRDDLRRDRRLAGEGYRRLAFTASDLLRHYAVAMAEIDRVLGRPTDLSRLRAWASLVNYSAYSDLGMRRLRTRWAVAMAVFGAS